MEVDQQADRPCRIRSAGTSRCAPQSDSTSFVGASPIGPDTVCGPPRLLLSADSVPPLALRPIAGFSPQRAHSQMPGSARLLLLLKAPQKFVFPVFPGAPLLRRGADRPFPFPAGFESRCLV